MISEKDRISKRKWAVKNKEAVARVRAERAAVIQKAKDKPCMDCGVKYPLFIMHFDHRDPSLKVKSVSQMTTHSLKKIQEEIAKCDVVCANCHGIRTHNGILTGKIKILGRYYAIK